MPRLQQRSRFQRRRGRLPAWTVRGAVSAACLALATCGQADGTDQVETGAPGTSTAGHVVYLLDGKIPITREEVDEWLPLMKSIQVNASKPQLRRLAITNIVLHRALGRLIDPAAWQDAKERATSLHARLLEGGEPGIDLPATETVQGTWKEIGMDVWADCETAEVGVWQPPLESVGAFYLYRLLEPPPDPWLPNSEVAVEMLRINYVPEESPKQLFLDFEEHVRLEVLDPEWEELLPLVLRNRMQVVVRSPEVPSEN